MDREPDLEPSPSTIVRPVRILLVTPGLGLGGSEQLTLAYARGVAARGHDVLVVHGPPELFGDADVAGIPRRRIQERLSVRTAANWFKALRSIAKEFRPDVAHAQSIRTTLVVAAALPRTPLLATVHGIEVSEERIAAVALRTSRAHVTAVSEASADGVRRHRVAPRVEVVPPGVDIDALERASLEATPTDVPARRPLVVCVARQFAVKGVDVLIDAFPQVLAAVPGTGLVLVGAGDEHDALIERVAELGIAHAVHFTGFQHNPAPYIALADIVVLPSRREGLPVTALEALALGRAVVATAVGGTPDVVRAGETGWLVPSEQPAALAGAILEALRDPEECRRRAAAGRLLVARSYSTSAMIDRIEKLYAEATSAGPSRLRPAYLAARAYQRARLARPRLHPASWSGVRILGYHRVADAHDSLAVTPARFREQMRAVAESGAQPIRLDRALELLRSPVAGRYVCVTFDDGYRDNLLAAAPVLAEFGIPATIYLPSRIIDGDASFHWYDDPPPALSWAEVAELLSGGLVDVQSHTLTHPLLPQVDDARCYEEIAGSKREIEAHTGYALTSFCYPAGLYGSREVEFVRGSGYAAAVTTNPGVNAGGGALLELRRTLVYGADDMRTFHGKLGGLLDGETVLRRALHARRSRAA
jgi:glycosyltransferase involved in cell wall biosynthesis/peptidoglycan/xylan/chitin deacetylase (PgdA/CDA1 family)